MFITYCLGLAVLAAVLTSSICAHNVDIAKFEQCSPCHCHRGPYPGVGASVNIADCSQRKLRVIPTFLPTDIEVLIMSHNPVYSIAEGAFEMYTNLQALIMHEWMTVNLQDRTFAGLKNLKILDLYSQLHGIQTWTKDAFLGLPDLEVLNISVEPVDSSSNTFEDAAQSLISLRELNVHFISNITERFLKGLKLERLFMTIDKALYIPPTLLAHLSSETKLKKLHIESRSLRAIPEGFLSTVLESLEEFYLTGKYIPRLPDNLFRLEGQDSETTPGVPSPLAEIKLIGVASISAHLFHDLGLLRRLTIQHFSDISDSAFTGLSRLKELTLRDSTTFGNVSEYMFKKLYDLTDLTISHTQIAELKEDHLADVNNLEFLDLSNNMLTNIESYTFWFMRKLRQLYVNRNRFEAFEQQVFEIGSLLTLDLSFNRLEHLEEEMFVDLYLLKELRLQGNKLSSLPNGIFDPLYSVHWIDLSYNDFMNFSGSHIEDCTELIVLDLRFNCMQHFNRTAFEEDFPRIQVNLVGNPLAGKDVCTKVLSRAAFQNGSEWLQKTKSGALNFHDAKTSEPAVIPQPTDTDKGVQSQDTEETTTKLSLNASSNVSGAPPKNCTLPGLVDPSKNASVNDCPPPAMNDGAGGEHRPGMWVTVLVSSVCVVLGVAVCVVLAVVRIKRSSTYDRVQADQESAVEEESVHYVGAGGEGVGRPRPIASYDDDFPMEHTRFV